MVEWASGGDTPSRTGEDGPAGFTRTTAHSGGQCVDPDAAEARRAYEQDT